MGRELAENTVRVPGEIKRRGEQRKLKRSVPQGAGNPGKNDGGEGILIFNIHYSFV